ncbi:MAG: hypothetical protein ACRD9L_15185 [Bryobacteraceae bacterium]
MTDRRNPAEGVFTADSLIQAFGDQAYHKALKMTIEALQADDIESCKALAKATRELLIRGYHKKPETKA